MGLLAYGHSVGEDLGKAHLRHEVLLMPWQKVAKQSTFTVSDLCKRKSTGALPLTPKDQDQIINMFSLQGHFLGPVSQSREVPNVSHLKGRIQKVKIT